MAFDSQASGQGIRPNPKKAGHGGSIFELGINIQTAFLNQYEILRTGRLLAAAVLPNLAPKSRESGKMHGLID